MRGRVLQTVVIGALTLLAGCATGTIPFAADLPQAQPLPTIRSGKDFSTPPEQTPPPDGHITVRPPDGPNIAREPSSRTTIRLDPALLGLASGVNWFSYLLVLAF